MTQQSGLISPDGTRIALKSVHIEGQADGLLASMTITQRYRNDSGKKLEVIYTFPLAFGAVLLGMEVTLGNQLFSGVIADKYQAREGYEKAIDEGDSPILVEQSAPDLYTVNLGNIENDEEVTVKFRYTQLRQLEFLDDYFLRLSIPCAIAPRYGDKHKDCGLAAHENKKADIPAEYPLTLKITLHGLVAEDAIKSHSHACTIERGSGNAIVSLNSENMLDYDFVLYVIYPQPRSLALTGVDNDGNTLVLANFCPPLRETREKKLCLKILADCSGSMAGDSIRTVRQCLKHLEIQLNWGDRVSYSRFGDSVQHETDGFIEYGWPASESLGKAFWGGTEANMGGTEMDHALTEVLNIPMPKGKHVPPCILLITDAAAWDMEKILQVSMADFGKRYLSIDGAFFEAEKIIRESRASGQRIFAIGVGSAPSENMLRELTMKTGGACAFASPGANVFLVVMNILDRIREIPAINPRIDWGAEPVWQSTLPLVIYPEKTVQVFASFAEPQEASPVLHWSRNSRNFRTQSETQDMIWSDELVRMSGAARLAMAQTREEALVLALKYQLVSEHTSMFLVRERKGENTGEPPILHQVPQMRAAGHGGFNSVVSSQKDTTSFGAGPRKVILNDIDVELFMQTLESTLPPLPSLALTPLGLLQDFYARTEQATSIADLMHLVVKTFENSRQECILSAIGEETSMSTDEVGLLFIAWLFDRLERSFRPSIHSFYVIENTVWIVSQPKKPNAEAARALMEKAFAAISEDSWWEGDQGSTVEKKDSPCEQPARPTSEYIIVFRPQKRY